MPTAALRRRCRLLVKGIVQGVGFRPFVYRCATALGIAGEVRNTAEGVVVDVEGPVADLAEMARRLREEAPPLADVRSVDATWLDPLGRDRFVIEGSAQAGGSATLVPPDVATCPACLAELSDPADRRFGYPFINCTDCGPRYSIIEGVPYDRARTTMRVFPLCDACRAEYEDPASRRFHAEPNACPVCGPRLTLLDVDGAAVACDDPITATACLLREGRIVAVKGIGGFHLAADAMDEGVVRRLRDLKQRDAKPFAVMASSLDAVRRFAAPDDDEARLLATIARPIVLLRKVSPFPLAPSVAPGNALIGVMLPYAPLHPLLLAATGRGALVLTSANPCDEPIVRDNDEAVRRLAGIADAYLVSDRDILARADDSVTAFFGGAPRPIRRSRGYTPLPVTLPVSGPSVLAVGGDLKNAFCVTRGDEAFLGPHVGDLANEATAAYFEEAVLHLCGLLDVRPSVIAHDLHPDYVSTRLARRLANGPLAGARLVPVQHHAAHVLSCLAEHGRSGPAIGLALDGTGWGPDGTSWGGEVLAIDGARWERLGRLRPIPLPGGDVAAREPWRIAVAMLAEMEKGTEKGTDTISRRELVSVPFSSSVPLSALQAIRTLATRGIQTRSSSVGRLFDCASALLGIRLRSSYEGEAAIALEQAAGSFPVADPYPWTLSVEGGIAEIDSRPLIAALAADVESGEMPSGRLAARFHATVIEAFLESVRLASRRTGLRTVALSGGALQNRILSTRLDSRLAAEGFEVLAQTAVPANDGGLALGQAIAALL